ncbi:MAG: glutathione S-transferase family protein [Deltaproteobacteria bacterium]|jgi:glutathione S-transferase|nr:glutathione S-transferase family protein [Deltaproteobacteria bacterium]
MTIKLYGTPKSRSARCLWMLEELAIAYENVAVNFADGGTQAPEYLAINPNGRIPALEDNGLVLFESLAINIHLARKYGAAKGLWSETFDDQSRTVQWSIWAMTEGEPPIVRTLMHRMFLPEGQRTEAEAVAGEQAFRKAVGVLDGALRDRPYILGNTFSVADLNIFGVLGSNHRALRTPFLDGLDPRELQRVSPLELDSPPNVARWARQCGERPALERVLAMR